MMIRGKIGIALVGAAALFATACGDNTQCGDGTVSLGGECVPAATACGDNATFNETTGRCDGNSCATGTTLTNGECVPDGSVICGDGTTYNATTGVCDPDITDCADGTVLVDGECIPYDDSIDGADVVEMAEPNGFGDTNSGQFTMPAVDQSVTITGCVTPYADDDDNGNLDIDIDAYVFQATGPTLLTVKVDGLNGLSGGFQMISADAQLAGDGWVRMGVNMVDDISERQVFLPKAGIYALGITDSRSIVLGEGAGDQNTCYLATVTQIAIPMPTAISNATATGQLGTAQFLSYDPAEGDILFNDLAAPGDAAAAGLVALVNDVYVTGSDFGSLGDAAAATVTGLADADVVVLVVDDVINFALTPVDFTLTVDAPGAALLPGDGSSVTVTHEDGLFSFYYFDVATAGDVAHLQFNQPDGNDLAVRVFGPGLVTLGDICFGCPNDDTWVQVQEAGRYYIGVNNFDLTAPATYAFEFTQTFVTPTAITIDTPISGAALSTDLNDWYRVDVGASDWLRFGADATAFNGDMTMDFYDGTVAGLMDSSLGPIRAYSFAGAADEFGRVVRGDETTQLLVRIRDDGTPVAGASYDFTIANRAFTDLGTVNDAAPVDMAAVALAADGVNRYLVNAASVGYTLTLSADGDANEVLTLSRLDRTENLLSSSTSANAGDPASLDVGIGDTTGLWVAFTVTEDAGTAGTYGLGVDGLAPVTYTVTNGTLAWTELCGNGGSVHATANDDDAISDAPLSLAGLATGFSLFGADVTELTVSTNGWLTFTPGYAGSSYFSNGSFPSRGNPNGVVSPFWDDLTGIEICTLVESDKVTIQWIGRKYVNSGTGPAVEFQAILHDGTNVIDFIYGPGHMTDTTSATVGIENLFGFLAETIARNIDGFAAAGTSYTLTPN